VYRSSEIKRTLNEEHKILSLQHILKEASVDDSNKSDEEIQIVDAFLISRAGVMS
jgi:hypothetical protein